MPFTAGQTLSCYEILGPLGAGSMGDVYRARDTRLEREVALKVLPDELARDAERLRRFGLEARTLASVSHQNVAQVYGIDQVGETCFMAMELVPGEDLAARLARGKLTVAEALDVCRQIAEGLEAAHEAGVIHRDLKPANVVLTPEGKAKVLDFGLAKYAGSDSGASVVSTEAGRVLGTPTYMAPEQARGKPLDKRVDLWAFGCVLYECLAGRRAFGGDTVGDVLAAVLEKEPDWSRLPGRTPVGVRALLGRCLDKDPHTRLRDMGEARVLLSRGAAAAPAARASSGARGARLRAAALAVVALGLGALAGRLVPARPSASPTPVLRQERLTDLAGVEEMPAVSPDGNRLAFVARVNGARQVFLRPIARAVIPQQITSEPADHAFPRWADDNTLIYFVHADEEGESGSIRELLVPGASLPRVLMSADGEADVGRKTGRIATFREDALGTTLVFVESGGVRTEVELRMPGARCGAPRWSADERRVAFEAQLGLSVAQIRVLDVASGEARVVARVAGQTRGLAWLPDDVGLVYSSSAGSTLPYPPTFSLRTVALDGSHDVPLPCEGAGYASYVEPDVTSSGGLVASRVAMQSDIYGYPVGGTPRENMVKARRITRQTGMVQVPSASPDGEQVAYLSDSGGRANVWVANVDGAHSMPITSEEEPRTIIGVPVWSPRGDWITYWKGLPDGTNEQWLVRPNGTDPRRLVQVRGAASWSHDGDWLYYMAPSADAYDVSTYRIPIDGGEAELVRHQASGLLVTSDERTCYFSLSDVQQGVLMRATPVDAELPELFLDLRSRIPLWPHMFALSYDDDWLATPLRDDGTTNLWRFSTADGTPHQVTDFGEQTKMIGRQVSWSKDGAFLFAAVMDIDADIVLLDGALR